MMNKVTYNLSIPYWIILERKTKEDKRVILNFNQYHNWVPVVRNMYKNIFTDSMGTYLNGLNKLSKIELIEYKLFYERNGDTPDTRNITNLIDKFFCDSLVHYGIIKDDNHNIIISTKDTWGGVDKNNPRVEITIIGEPI